MSNKRSQNHTVDLGGKMNQVSMTLKSKCSKNNLCVYVIADTHIFTYLSKSMKLFLFQFLLISTEPQ